MQTASRSALLHILLPLLLATAPAAAHADVYKCVSDGQTSYSSTPCDTKGTLAQPQVAPVTQTTINAKQVSVMHYEPVESESSKSGVLSKLGLDSKDAITIVLMLLVPVALVTVMFMSRKTSSLTK